MQCFAFRKIRERERKLEHSLSEPMLLNSYELSIRIVLTDVKGLEKLCEISH